MAWYTGLGILGWHLALGGSFSSASAFVICILEVVRKRKRKSWAGKRMHVSELGKEEGDDHLLQQGGV